MMNVKPGRVRILVVDDEENTRIVLARALELLGYQLDSASDGKQALERLEQFDYDLILLDLKMPEMDGVQVMEYIRHERPDLPVIVLTAHATLESAIQAVKAGATDYLLKPQRIADIQEAIQNGLKRRVVRQQRERLIAVMQGALSALQEDEEEISAPSGVPLPHTIRAKSISLDPERRRVVIYSGDADESRVDELVADLTANQAAILSFMILHPQKVLTSLDLACDALGYRNLSEREAEGIVRPHIARLRRKIEADSSRPKLIRSVRGKGYLFSPP
jgi:DNA-binding response OmpR family regulator